MKKRGWILVISVAMCATAAWQLSSCAVRRQSEAELEPETMLSTYHAQPGKDVQLQDALARTWLAYTHDKAVFEEPHIVVRTRGVDGSIYFTEIFTWVSHYAPDHASDAIKTRWRELEALCKRPDGKSGIEGHEVKMIVPAR